MEDMLNLRFSRSHAPVIEPVDDASRAKLKALDAVYAVVEIDRSGHFRDANDRFLSAVGYRREELMGKHHRTLVSRDEAASPAYEQFWKELREGKGKAAEYKRIRKDGTVIWLRAAYCPIITAGEVTGVIKLALDTSHERAALDRGQGVIEMSLDGYVLDANPMLLDMVGYRIEELRGQHHRALVNPEYARTPDYENHWRKLRAGEFVSGTFERIHKDKSKVYMRASYNPVFDQDGRLLKIVKYATDVTAQQISIEELQKVVSELSSSTESLAASSTQLESTAQTTMTRATSVQAQSEEIATTMHGVSAATEELSASVKEIARSSATAAQEAQAGGLAVAAASEAVGKLGNVSQHISGVVELIRNIADQTNLLALNAMIEAAGAGAAGRGFKVVADEVKALSLETARATEEISIQVSGIVDIAKNATEAVGTLSGIIETMVQQQTTLAVTSEEQQAVTAEIASHSSAVAASTTAASAEAAGLNASAGEAGGVAKDVGAAVTNLREVSSRLTGLSERLRHA